MLKKGHGQVNQVGDADHDKKKASRSNMACIQCRKRHVKCDGTGPPCSRCKASHLDCEYIEADKKIVISMKYLSNLHSEIQRLKVENTSLRNARNSSNEGGNPQHTLIEGLDATDNERDEALDDEPNGSSDEVIPPFLDSSGRIIHSRTGERIYIGSSSMTLFGLEINKLVAGVGGHSPESNSAETVLEREGNAYRIMLGKTHTRPGIDVNFTLPSYSYAMLLIDTFISYNDGCFYFFNEGLIKEGLRRMYNEKAGEPFMPEYGAGAIPDSPEGKSILETIWFCKVLLIFAIGEMYLGTANNLNGYKLVDKTHRKKQKLNDDSHDHSTTKLPGSGFFNQASELFTGVFASGAIDNCAREGGIEVLLLYAFYLQVADCTVASYFYFGLALRASLILGLHVDAGRDTLTRCELEHRRRLWWTVYIYERMLASKAGLPLSFNDDDIATPLPDDFDMNTPSCGNYVFPEAEFIRNCVKITRINTKILRKLYTRHPSQNILPIVHHLVVSLLRWKKDLPEYINCDYSAPEIQTSRLVVNLMTEYFQGVNLAVRPLLFHFVMLNLKSKQQQGRFIDLSRYSSVVLTLLNASFQASINTIRSLWALMPDNMVALFGYMDREYLFTSTVTLLLFNSTFGVHEATLEHLDHALMIFTKMRNLGNHPATLRREQILRLLKVLDFHGAMRGLIKKHTDDVNAPDPTVNSQDDSNAGFKLHQYMKSDSPIGLSSGILTPESRLNPTLLSSGFEMSHQRDKSGGLLRQATAAQQTGPGPGSGSGSGPGPEVDLAQPFYWNSGGNSMASETQTPNAAFSPSLLSAIDQIEDVPSLDDMMSANPKDAELWRDITSQAVWLAGEFDEEFSNLVKKNG